MATRLTDARIRLTLEPSAIRQDVAALERKLKELQKAADEMKLGGDREDAFEREQRKKDEKRVGDIAETRARDVSRPSKFPSLADFKTGLVAAAISAVPFVGPPVSKVFEKTVPLLEYGFPIAQAAVKKIGERMGAPPASIDFVNQRLAELEGGYIKLRAIDQALGPTLETVEGITKAQLLAGSVPTPTDLTKLLGDAFFIETQKGALRKKIQLDVRKVMAEGFIDFVARSMGGG